jgi:hypothetical protein
MDEKMVFYDKAVTYALTEYLLIYEYAIFVYKRYTIDIVG